MQPNVCEVCGISIETGRFCSSICQAKYASHKRIVNGEMVGRKSCKIYIRTCNGCGKKFVVSSVNRRLDYCSRICYDKLRNKIKTEKDEVLKHSKTCPVCKKNFIPTSRTQKFCSLYCRAYNASNSRQKQDGKIIAKKTCKIYYGHCKHCQRVFVIKPTQHPKSPQMFCSKKCRQEHGNPEQRVPVPMQICEICGKLYQPSGRPSKNHRQHYCSKSCGTKHRNLIHGQNTDKPEVRAKIAKTLKDGWITRDPEVKARILEGAAKGRENNGNFLATWIQQPENQERMSRYWTKFYNEHPEKHPLSKMRRNFMSRLEKDTEAVLNMLCIKAKWNKVLRLKDGYCFPDFTVLDSNIVIECNGDHWHNPIELANREKRYNDNGYSVVMLSEKCIKSGPVAIVQTFLNSPLKEYVMIKPLVA